MPSFAEILCSIQVQTEVSRNHHNEGPDHAQGTSQHLEKVYIMAFLAPNLFRTTYIRETDMGWKVKYNASFVLQRCRGTFFGDQPSSFERFRSRLTTQ